MNYRNPGLSVKGAGVIAATFFFLNSMQVSAEQTSGNAIKPIEINNKNSMGNVGNGYHYELWTNGSGSASMTVLGVDARFKASWSNVGDMVARVGLKYDEKKTATQIGTFTSDYAFNRSGINGLAYFGIYGWSVDPLVEYYILEDWNQWRPDASNGHTSKGTITVDGAQYQLFTKQQNGQPSIKGTQNFTQFWSIRAQTRNNGHISISDHFAQWEKNGMKLGKLYEVKLKAEGYNGSGSCEFTKAVVLLDGKPPSVPTAISFAQETSPDLRTFFGNGSEHGAYTLISLNGAKVRTMALSPSAPAVFPTNNLAPGMYYLLFQGEGKVPVTRPIVVK
jgi:hypothetical protein